MELSVRYDEILVLEQKKKTLYIVDNPLYLKIVYVKV